MSNKKLILPVLFAFLITGCATGTNPDDANNKSANLATSMAEANELQKAGRNDQAVSLFKNAALRFPGDKTPWLRIAQIKFDSGNYGEAIMNAQEALQRDPTDKIANSILTVSGLRLSTKALSDLRSQNALSGTVKTEAQDLAKLLRENLGETVLVPPPPKPVSATPPGRPRGPAAKTLQPGVKPVSAEKESGQPNPFGRLK